MIQHFSNWSKVNEVEELKEKPKKKFIDAITQAYAKYPKFPPSRDINDYPNSTKSQENIKILNTARQRENILSSSEKQTDTAKKQEPISADSWKSMWASYKPMEREDTTRLALSLKSTLKLDEFIKQRANLKLKDILLAVIKDWYQWPANSKSRNILEKYISNDDDLDNVTLKKIIDVDPTIILPALGIGALACFAAVPAIIITGTELILQASISATYKYIAYGDIEEIEDDPIINSIAPFLPKIKGVDPFKTGSEYDPFTTDYQSVFNTMMLLIYDTWNLCMGQESNIDWKRPVWDESKNTHPIRNFNTGNKSNYLDIYMQTYCKSSDIKSSFVKFISELNTACTEDQLNPEYFSDCPFFYTGGKILLINTKNKRSVRLTPDEFKSWMKNDYAKNTIIPTIIPLVFYYEERDSNLFANSFIRKNSFFSNTFKKLNAQIKVYSSTGVEIEKLTGNAGELYTLPDLENEIIVKMFNNSDYKFRIQYENISVGGNNIVFEMVKKKAKSKKPTVSLDSIKEDITLSSPSEFSSMRDI